MLPERSLDTWLFMHVYVVCICVCVCVCVCGVYMVYVCGVYVCMGYMYVVGVYMYVMCVSMCVCVCESMELSVRVHEKSSIDHQSHCNQQERLLFLKHVGLHIPVQNGNDLERDV